MKTLRTLLIVVLTMSIVLIACDEDDPQIKITSISFNSAAVEVVEGTTVNLDDLLTIEGEDADQAQITFSSTDEEVVTVSGNTLTAAGVGQTTVEATETNTSQTATIEVTVIAKTVAVTGITLDQETADLKVGETLQLTATVAPVDATEQGVIWSVDFPSESRNLEDSPTDVATVSETGLVTAVSAGEVVVTAKTKDGDFMASAAIGITNIAVTGITLSPDPVEIDYGESVQLTATIAPENATIKTVTWSLAMVEESVRISQEAPTVDTYLEINEDGLLSAKERCDACQFTATATTSDGEISSSVDVTINYVPITSITISPESVFEVTAGETEQMQYSITPANASNQEVTWEISIIDAMVCGDARTLAAAPNYDEYATIDENGLLSAHKRYNDVCNRLAVLAHVDDLEDPAKAGFDILTPVIELTILNSSGGEAGNSISFGAGCEESYSLGVTVDPEDATDTSVTWSIQDQDYFQINQSGQISAKTTIPWPVAVTFEVMVTANDGSMIASTVEMSFDNSPCD